MSINYMVLPSQSLDINDFVSTVCEIPHLKMEKMERVFLAHKIHGIINKIQY